MFTAKDISSLKNSIKEIFSSSYTKHALLISAVIFAFYLLFNIFAFFKLVDLADRELDKKIIHEIEHVDKFVDMIADTLFFYSNREFEEDDFQTITENAYLLQIYDTAGNILYESPNINLIGNLPLMHLSLDEIIVKDNIEFNDYDLRVIYKKLDDNDYAIIQLATPRTDVVNFITEFEIFNLVTLPLVLALIIMISLFLSLKIHRKLNNIINLANEITAQNISKRLDYTGSSSDTYVRLSNTLNNLFERLENQINRIGEFTNNASHQLLSPLTAINSELEYILKKERNIPEYIETLETLRTQTENMIKIVQTLLILARESDGLKSLNTFFNLEKLIRTELIPRYKSHIVLFEIDKEIIIRGSSDYTTILLSNLIDNAIKYSDPENIEIIVKSFMDDNNINIVVKDKGYGIPGNEKSKVFEKFYRGSNSENSTGHGLGLSLVSLIVKQMKGEIKIIDNFPSGTVFHLTFPKPRFT